MEQLVGGLYVPGEEFYSGFVTWSALEDSLSGLRNSLSGQQTSPAVGQPPVAIDAGNQTDPVST